MAEITEIEVGPTPVDLTTAAGVADTGNGVSFFRMQVRDAAVYRATGDTAPDTGTARGWRHASGSVAKLRLREGPEREWLWTAGGTALVLIESGEF